MTLAFVLVWKSKVPRNLKWKRKGMDRSPRQQTLCNHHWENIVVILSSDSASMWSGKVLKRIESELGNVRILHVLCKVYMFVLFQKIAGCLVAESIKTRKVHV
ncbi:protein CHROMOSOME TRANSMISSION FIDELITY 7-like isoform X1 [Malus sylvestris]|uniref:protein CHROMOSOME TRANSMISSION FIDELITY 7-like isoform X1 n=1 Tax=Malus sylvestris TaxID=3752 RepID=UPI0021AC5900|nr:protein CHROMOSOME TRANSMISSION FIDELITY 7-like isoform X1 [Malus sylvestris]